MGAPDYNEIALEKNVLYFQRSLSTVGFIPSLASLFFANGNDGHEADTVNEAYYMRLKMELTDVGAEAIVRSSQQIEAIAVLDRITACEAGTW